MKWRENRKIPAFCVRWMQNVGIFIFEERAAGEKEAAGKGEGKQGEERGQAGQVWPHFAKMLVGAIPNPPIFLNAGPLRQRIKDAWTRTAIMTFSLQARSEASTFSEAAECLFYMTFFRELDLIWAAWQRSSLREQPSNMSWYICRIN